LPPFFMSRTQRSKTCSIYTKGQKSLPRSSIHLTGVSYQDPDWTA